MIDYNAPYKDDRDPGRSMAPPRRGGARGEGMGERGLLVSGRGRNWKATRSVLSWTGSNGHKCFLFCSEKDSTGESLTSLAFSARR